MKQTQICFVSGTSLVLFLFRALRRGGKLTWETTPSAAAERSAVCRGGFKGDLSRFEEYRYPRERYRAATATDDRRKKEDYYLYADSYKTGLNDQSYTLRVGRYGILDMEFQWDQIPHWFSDVARTPMSGRAATRQSSVFPPSLRQPRHRRTVPPLQPASG